MFDTRKFIKLNLGELRELHEAYSLLSSIACKNASKFFSGNDGWKDRYQKNQAEAMFEMYQARTLSHLEAMFEVEMEIKNREEF